MSTMELEHYLKTRLLIFYGLSSKPLIRTALPTGKKNCLGETSVRNNAQLSLSGGSEQTQFLVSGNYLNETTVFLGEGNYRRGSLFSNINHQSNDKRFKINFSTTYSTEDNRLPQGDFSENCLWNRTQRAGIVR